MTVSVFSTSVLSSLPVLQLRGRESLALLILPPVTRTLVACVQRTARLHFVQAVADGGRCGWQGGWPPQLGGAEKLGRGEMMKHHYAGFCVGYEVMALL